MRIAVLVGPGQVADRIIFLEIKAWGDNNRIERVDLIFQPQVDPVIVIDAVGYTVSVCKKRLESPVRK